MVLVVLPGFSAAAAQDIERLDAELAGVVLETGSEPLAHGVTGHAGELVTVMVPGTHGDHGVLTDLALAVEVAKIAVVDLRRAALDGALQAGGDTPPANHAAERAGGVVV